VDQQSDTTKRKDRRKTIDTQVIDELIPDGIFSSLHQRAQEHGNNWYCEAAIAVQNAVRHINIAGYAIISKEELARLQRAATASAKA
jgi:hypothetical protein